MPVGACPVWRALYKMLCCAHRFAAHVAAELAPLETSRQALLVGGQAYAEQGPLAAFQGTFPGAWCCPHVPSAVANIQRLQQVRLLVPAPNTYLPQLLA